MRWLPFLAIREQLLGVSGPYIMGARSNVPPIIDWPRKAARGSTIFPYRSSRVEKQVFPRQCRSRRTLPASPWSKGLEQILTLCIGIALAMAILSSGWMTRDAHAAPQVPSTSDHTVTIMSQNMFGEGADFTPALTATSFSAFEAAVGTIYQEVQASNIPERAVAVADEIGEAQPALVGLQEVFQWLTGPLLSPPATTVQFDSLQSLLDALAQQGLHYAPVAISTNADIEAPSNLGFDVRLIDHDVLLARTDLPDLTLTNIQVHHFVHFLSANSIIGTITIPRGWISVDATIKGKTFRFLTTHLDSVSSAVRVAQGNELLQGPANTSLPVIFSGDF